MAEIARPHESKFYHKMSNWYDRLFGCFFYPAIKSTIKALQIPPGAKVLEVGIGTGLSLYEYPSHVDVVGIDLSPHMLARATRKLEAKGVQNIKLRNMDALNLEFGEAEFDYVMAFHLVTVVPDCHRLLAEMCRVCKPGGTVVIINHFRSHRWWVAPIVDAVDPVTRHFGWYTTLKLSDFIKGAPLHIKRNFKTASSLFTVLLATRTQDQPAPAAHETKAAPSAASTPVLQASGVEAVPK